MDPVQRDWLAFATPVAVIIAAAVQKLDSWRLRGSLKKLDTIHELVNGNAGEAKRIAMMNARRIAELTKDPKDLELADQAQKIYEEHIFRMIRVDTALSKDPKSWP